MFFHPTARRTHMLCLVSQELTIRDLPQWLFRQKCDGSLQQNFRRRIEMVGPVSSSINRLTGSSSNFIIASLLRSPPSALSLFVGSPPKHECAQGCPFIFSLISPQFYIIHIVSKTVRFSSSSCAWFWRTSYLDVVPSSVYQLWYLTHDTFHKSGFSFAVLPTKATFTSLFDSQVSHGPKSTCAPWFLVHLVAYHGIVAATRHGGNFGSTMSISSISIGTRF